MATIRLTADMRDSIKTALLAHAFAAREAELEAASAQLAREVYDDVYAAPIRKAMAAMPAGFLPEAEDMYVSFDGEMTSVEWGESRRIASDHAEYRSAAKVYAARDPLAREYFRLNKLKSKLEAEQQEARRNAVATLKSCTTVAKLLRVWPEVEPFTRSFAPSGSNLPAVPRSLLNKQFSLPADGVAA